MEVQVPNGYIMINGQLIKVYEQQVSEAVEAGGESPTEAPAPSSKSTAYIIDNAKFGISNDGTNPASTTSGINAAIAWAKSEGYSHVYLTGGVYSVQVDLEDPAVVIDMPSNMHFEMSKDCTLELVGNSNPSYRVFNVFYKKNVKISGGRIKGDKDTHRYEMYIKFERGGVDSNGQLNDNPNFIRSEVVDRKLNKGLLTTYRLWSIDKITTPKYNFFQYKDEVSSAGFKLSRYDGGFAPKSPNGRGWGGSVDEYNKMVFQIDITNCPLTDEEIGEINAKIDNMYYTHEGGFGIGIFASWNVEVYNVEISHCTGDGIMTGLGAYPIESNPVYTYDDVGGNILIHECDIHHNRRQGISLCGPNDVHVLRNKIHHIGFADDNTTTDFRNATAPMFGIDIESMVAEKGGFPYEHLHYEKQGLQTNYRITIEGNHIFNNARGHFVNCDGTYITVKENIFEGWTVGHVSSYPNYYYVKYLNNIFNNVSLIVAGNNYVDGVIMEGGYVLGNNTKDAFIANVKIRNGKFSLSSLYGYFGSPSVVDVATGTFTFPRVTEIGSGGKVSFESWLGKLPTGIDINKVYWTVNATAYGFQVSETKGGAPVVITDAGEAGFCVARLGYGSTVIENVTVERDWRDGTAVDNGFSVLLVGGTIRNITVKNYDIDIKPLDKYVGRPISIDGLVHIEGAANFQACNISNAEFMKGKAKRVGGDIAFGNTSVNHSRKIKASNLKFENADVILEGDVVMINSMFFNANIGKSGGSPYSSTLLNSYIENSAINLHWITKPNHITVSGCTLKNVKKGLGAGVVFANNIEI